MVKPTRSDRLFFDTQLGTQKAKDGIQLLIFIISGAVNRARNRYLVRQNEALCNKIKQNETLMLRSVT